MMSCSVDRDDEQSALDGPDDTFLIDGKADTGGIQEGSVEAQGVLRLVNEADFALLHDEVGLHTRAADNIIVYKLGDDETAGTNDDEVFETLTELDAVPYVGPVAFGLLLEFAQANGYVVDPITDPEIVWVDRAIDSDHPYTNNASNERYIILDLRAAEITLHFERLELAENDTLTILDRFGNIFQTYTNTGDLRDVFFQPIPGRSVVIHFETDGSITRFGYSIDGYSFRPLVPERPELVREESITLDHWASIFTSLLFDGRDVYIPFRYGYGGWVLERWMLSDSGLVMEEHLGGVSGETLGQIDDQILAAERGRLDIVGQDEDFPLCGGVADTYQIIGDDRGFIYVYAEIVYDHNTYMRDEVQIINTNGLSGWEQVLPEDGLIYSRWSAGRTGMTVVNNWLVIRNYLDGPGHIDVYDTSDIYNPVKETEIYVGDLPPGDNGPPVVAGDLLFVGSFAGVSIYDLTTGYEIATVELPETAGTMLIDNETLYVAGESTIHVVDVNDSENPEVVDQIRVTQNPALRSIDRLHKFEDRLYAAALTRIDPGLLTKTDPPTPR